MQFASEISVVTYAVTFTSSKPPTYFPLLQNNPLRKQVSLMVRFDCGPTISKHLQPKLIGLVRYMWSLFG